MAEVTQADINTFADLSGDHQWIHTDDELPLLEALDERGGSAPAREVVEAVGEKLNDRFTETDLGTLSSGKSRWQNRVQFTRLRLKERGLLKDGSQRGVWELSDAGRKRLKSGG